MSNIIYCNSQVPQYPSTLIPLYSPIQTRKKNSLNFDKTLYNSRISGYLYPIWRVLKFTPKGVAITL